MMKCECLHQLWHWLMDNLADGLVLSHPLRQTNGLSQSRERWNIATDNHTPNNFHFATYSHATGNIVQDTII